MNNEDLFKRNQIGYYKVGNEIYLSKHKALVDSAAKKTKTTFHWFDDAFDLFDRNLLGKQTLNQLYKERAQMLRDKYDYLILNYSGGCDSWNILKTFLDNGIKLDQVMVCWPFKAGEAGLYQPNKKDVRANNFMSEWDFTTKPDLEWLAKTHPDIKIEMIDWADPFISNPNFVNNTSFDNLNHFHNLADLSRSTLFSKTEQELIEKGKTVGTIWGLDKPNIVVQDETVYMAFNDSIITVAHPAPCNPYGTEYFYWTPDMPLLTFEMAAQTANWFKARPRMQPYMYNKTEIYTNKDLYLVKVQVNQVATRDGCYTTWADKTNNFQVNKPWSPIRADKDFWLYQNKDLTHHVDAWQSLYNELLVSIDNTDAIVRDKQKCGYRTIPTKWHAVCKF